jgi:hypothetical protein
MDYLVGAPIDPLFQSEIDDWQSTISLNGFSVRERYWANYVSASALVCESINILYDLAVEENWNSFEATDGLEIWLGGVMKPQIREMPGFSSLSDDELTGIIATAFDQGGCLFIWNTFMDFIGG